MSNQIVEIDNRIDQMLQEKPAQAIHLIMLEYQGASDKNAVVTAIAAKLVTQVKMGLARP